MIICKIDAVPTIKEKLAAIEIALKTSEENYQTAQAAVDEYKNHWIGQNHRVRRFDSLDPQLSHVRSYHKNLRTERRKLMWHAIKKGEDFPADLTESDIPTSCLVSPSHANGIRLSHTS